jgi:RimJ/RimL family protein N-acetyltransferase
MALLSVAHPEHRSELLARAKQRNYVFFGQIEPRARYPKERQFVHVSSRGVPTLIRPLRETDEPMLADLFYSLSEETIQSRYLAPLLQMPNSDLVRYLHIDDSHDVAMVAETQPKDGSEPQIVGVARYHGNRGTRLADVAFVMRDDWQGLGYGSLFLEQLIQIAKSSGFEGFTAEVLTSNRAMLRVFERAGLFIERDYDGSTVSLRLLFEPPS